MRVLIACEFSGIVRDAFKARGHEAWSCDLLPSERPAGLGPVRGGHLQGDVRQWLMPVSGVARDPFGMPWDLMIAHPPCTHLAVSGARYFARKQKEQAEALGFVQALLDAPIPMIALENPVSVISSRIRKPDQIIQPWMFGHGATKATCLWLKGLPKLTPTNVISEPAQRRDNLTPSGQNKLGPSKDRWKLRSRTYQGVADAMAEQWDGAK